MALYLTPQIRTKMHTKIIKICREWIVWHMLADTLIASYTHGAVVCPLKSCLIDLM